MHHRINPDIDIIGYIIEEVLKAKPEDVFCRSLKYQYRERGGLSKKQMEGLHGKAMRITGIHPGRMATLEAIIKKKHVTHRSEITIIPLKEEKDTHAGSMIMEILKNFPLHKRVLLFKFKYEQDGKLPAADKEELISFYRVLIGG